MTGHDAGQFDDTPRFRLRDAVDWRDVQGDVVALDVRRAVYLATNDAGAVLWTRLSEGATRRQLVAALLDQFDVVPAAAEADVDSFLRRLEELDLVEVHA